MIRNYPKTAGWYAFGFQMDNGEVLYNDVLFFDGESWTNGSETITSVFDPVLQHRVSIDCADHYMPQ